jgi:hypothetical protein
MTLPKQAPAINDLTVRPATPADASGWVELVESVFGRDYPAPQVYDRAWATEQLIGPNAAETWVAESGGRIHGAISILQPYRPNDNPIANVGRHLVHPGAFASRCSEVLLGKVNAVSAQRRQMAILRVPAADTAQQLLLERLGFICAGFQPAKHRYREPEAVLFYVRVGAPAPAVRLPLSRSLPQINELATLVLQSLNIPNPEIVRDGATGYPVRGDIEARETTPEAFEQAKAEALPSSPPLEISSEFNRGLGVLRIPEPAPIRALLGYREAKPVAGLTFYYDRYDKCLRLLDCFSADDLSTGALLQQAVKLSQEQLEASYIEVDCLITAPRVLKSSEQLGFVPVAYLPGICRRRGCCVDLVKLVKLHATYTLEGLRPTAHARAIMELVDRGFEEQKVGISTVNLLRGLAAFEGLGDGELCKVARLFTRQLVQPGERLFSKGDPGDAAYIIMRGQIDILLAEDAEPVASLGNGSIFGEQAFLEGAPRTASAVARQPTILLGVRRPTFNALTEAEPHLGLVIMRNMALELSRRLRKANLSLTATSR